MDSYIDWFDGSIDAAFDKARTLGQPLFLYWGAVWCPPCNRIKADLFQRERFVEQTRALVPVFLDGDSAGAQAVAARLMLRSYPSMVLYHPDGTEITRLPGEPEGQTGAAILSMAVKARYRAVQSLEAALNGARELEDREWQLLSFYAWDADEGQILGQHDPATTLAQLARACPPGDAAQRLNLHALRMAAEAGPLDDAAAVASVLGVCASAGRARANMDILLNSGATLVKNLAPADSPARVQLAAALYAVAAQFAEDIWLTTPDRMAALRLQVRLSRLGFADAALADSLNEHVAELLLEADDPHERHALINSAAGALAEVGQSGQADRLLRAELGRSHAPYYFMLALAANARRRRDLPAALEWYERAWRGATGTATRLQWGATYLLSVLELAPGDIARLETAAAAILAALRATPDAWSQRNRSQFQRMGDALRAAGSVTACAELAEEIARGLAAAA